MIYRSKSGYQITVGDVIAYPVRQGSNMWMIIAEVKQVDNDGDIHVQPLEQNVEGTWVAAGRARRTQRTERMVHVNLKQIVE